MLDVRKCNLCHQSIVWIKSVAGNAIPIDPFPVEGGELIVICGVCQAPMGEILENVYGPERYTSHVRTCPVGTANLKARKT